MTQNRIVATPCITRRKALLALACLSGQAVGFAANDASSFTHNFSGMPLMDQEGKRFAFRSLAGRVLLVNFVFTGCSTVCPVQTRALAEILSSQASSGAGKPLHFVSISLNPLQDTPSALKAFGQRMSVDFARWSFVTGSSGDLERVSERLRLFRSTPDTKRPDDHATTLWLVDARGQLRQRLHGNPVDTKRVAAELTTLRLL